MATIMAHINTPAEAPGARSNSPISAKLDSLVLECLSKAPADRPSSAEALAHRLDEIELENPWTRARAAAQWRMNLSLVQPVNHGADTTRC